MFWGFAAGPSDPFSLPNAAVAAAFTRYARIDLLATVEGSD